jgi:HPt (histidine-containing phosphotransfer) domain-containing protein
MVILDKRPAGQPTDGSNLMSSIDAGTVRQMFGADLSLFRSLLVRLLREYTDLAVPVHVSPDDQALRTHLTGRTHKLKGSAGMIGATDIMRMAGAAENALNQGRSAEVVEGLMRQLASALAILSEEAGVFLKHQGESEASAGIGTANGPNADMAQLDELCGLLESQNLVALDKFTRISQSLSETVGPLRFDRLRDAIENLDFQLGAQLLREARLPGTPNLPPMMAERRP